MKAAYVDAFGAASSIRYGQLPEPLFSADQVLVRVNAVAVDAVDTVVRSGHWSREDSFPLVVGRDLVGEVAAVGAAVTGAEPGQQVWTNSAGYDGRAGATAELVPVDQDRVYRLPLGADPISFIASVHPGATASGVLERAHQWPGETVAVVGANGSVGMCLVQVAAARGAPVVAMIRDERSAELLRQLGATQVVVCDAADAPRRAASAAEDGVDILIDTTGHVDIGAVPAELNARGRAVLIASHGRAELDLWSFYTREIQVLGFVMSAMTVSELSAAAAWINARHETLPLRVSVGAVMEFAAAANAHAALETADSPRMPDGTRGRFVLRP